jgi:hypothetical protein
MVLLRKQNLFKTSGSHVLTVPQPWFEEHIKDLSKPVSVIGLDCLIVLPRKKLSDEQIRKMCENLITLIPMEQDGVIGEPSGT